MIDLDDVIFGFHRYVDKPTPADVAWWVRAFPQWSDEIRAHAVEIIDMEGLASSNDERIFRLATDG